MARSARARGAGQLGGALRLAGGRACVGGSLRRLQHYLRKAFPAPAIRARRRVETPPGAQAQADWGYFPRVRIGVRQCDLLAFVLQLSFSRFDAIVWAERKDLMSWLWAHNHAFAFLGGVLATVRVDKEKTAVSRGASAWGEINPTYRRYAQTLRFHVDTYQPRAPESKGKVEHRIRTTRNSTSEKIEVSGPLCGSPACPRATP